MKRDTVINVLLIMAGIFLAVALFGAGVLWKSRAARNPSSPSSFAARTGPAATAVNTRHQFVLDA